MSVTERPPQLPGETTLLWSWRGLAALSSGAHLVCNPRFRAAVFPAWDPLNNAILRDWPSAQAASSAAAELFDVYAEAGVTSWALWLPSRALNLDVPDDVTAVDGMTRDTTTLVMTCDLAAGLPSDSRVLRTTVEAAGTAGDEPLPAASLTSPNVGSVVEGWALVDGARAVAGAWSCLHSADVGVYAVGTAPGWRRRGLARALMLHVLADASRRGARTASLQSTRMGVPLYLSLGFRAVGRYDEWVPARGTAAIAVENSHDQKREVRDGRVD